MELCLKQYEIQQLFDSEATDTNGRRVMKDITASIDTNNDLWIYFGKFS